jgi:alpha-1,2-mannosyltransferase
MSTTPFQPSLAPAGRRWFVAGLVLLFFALSIQYGFKAQHNRSAFQRWQPQISDLGNGVDIAQRYNYPNPPIMALLLYPLARLPEVLQHGGLSEQAASTVAALAWFYIKAVLTLLALRWVFELVEERDRPFPLWARCLAVLLALRPIMGDLQHGNVNLFILFLVVAALAAYQRGRDLLAGCVLGLAIACKVTPALFLPYLVWKRAWKTLAGCAAGLALFLWPGLIPGLIMGVERNQHHLMSWYQDMVYPYVVEGKVTSEHHNQSLPGLVARLATHSPSFSTYVNNEYTPTHYDNLLDLRPEQARWIVKGCMALFALVVVWSCRTPTAPRQSWRLAAEFSIVLLGMLLFSERTWKHHCVTLILPFAVICYYLAACSPGRTLGSFLVGALVLATVLIATTSNALPDDHAGQPTRLHLLFAKQAQVYGAYVLAYFVLLTSLVVLLRRPDHPANLPAE